MSVERRPISCRQLARRQCIQQRRTESEANCSKSCQSIHGVTLHEKSHAGHGASDVPRPPSVPATECFLTNRYCGKSLPGFVSERVSVQGKKDNAWKTLRSIHHLEGGRSDGYCGIELFQRGVHARLRQAEMRAVKFLMKRECPIRNEMRTMFQDRWILASVVRHKYLDK